MAQRGRFGRAWDVVRSTAARPFSRKKNGSSNTEIPSPELGQIVRGNVLGMQTVFGPGGVWARVLHPSSEWLGPYTPPYLEVWILKAMREDPQLSLGLSTIKSPFHGVTYRLEGGTPETRAFCEATILEARWFDRAVRSILNSIDFGFQAHEILWGVEDVETEPADPSGAGAKKWSDRFVIRGLKEIDPGFVLAIKVDELRNLAGIVISQIGVGDNEIPAEKLLHAVHGLEWDSWWGNSRLKRAFHPFHQCNHEYLELARYMESKGNPPLVGTAPYDFRLDENESLDGQQVKNALEVLASAMLALRNGGVASLPHEADEKGNNKWAIRELEASQRAEQFITSINHLQSQKLRALGCPERIATQDTATGSFAMSETHVDVFLMILEEIMRDTLLPALNRLAELTVKYNFPKGTKAPHFEASELSRQKQQFLAELVKLGFATEMRTKDGKVYTPAQMLDYPKSYQSLNVPFHPAELVATDKPEPAPAVPEPSPENDGGDDPEGPVTAVS